MSRYSRGVHQALDGGFFGTLNDEDYEQQQVEHPDAFEGIMVNAMEWLSADGNLVIRGGPLLSVGRRQWLELFASKRLGLYEVTDVAPGESPLLKDILFPQQAPSW